MVLDRSEIERQQRPLQGTAAHDMRPLEPPKATAHSTLITATECLKVIDTFRRTAVRRPLPESCIGYQA